MRQQKDRYSIIMQQTKYAYQPDTAGFASKEIVMVLV
jgi:hypothetical protein